MQPKENRSVLTGETSLSKTVRIAEDKAAYDAACKRILAQKRILAWIMKECVEEYRDDSIEDIESKYIEGTPIVGAIGVLPDEAEGADTDVSPVIHGEGVEDSSINEGTVTYDIRFRAIVPKGNSFITMLINAEGQRDYTPGYPLTKRGIYYCSRMISSQYGTEFTQSHYEKLKKVYSIWICLDPPKYRQNTITRYRIQEEDLIGSVREPAENYDLMMLVMVCLGQKEKAKSRLLQMLSVLFSRKQNQKKKREILEKEFDLPMTQELGEEVSSMCNFSDVVEREARAEGLAKGMAEGLEQGLEQGSHTAKLEIACHMREDGLETALICRYTGLERELVESF